MLRIAAFLMVAGALSACGQRGPLFMPNKPAVLVTPEVPAPIPTTPALPASK